MTDALGRTFTYVYDALDRRTHVIFPDGTFTVTTYDALGRHIAETDQNNNTTWYAFDALHRLVAVTNALGNVTRYTYDELGNLIAQTDANGHTTTFEYDSMGRRIKRTLPGGQVETYQYDLAGNLVSKTDFNGYTTTYQYDSMNRLVAKIPDPRRGEQPVSLAYNELGLRTNMLDASGVTQYRYDVRGRLVQKLKTWTAVGLTVALNYTHDACGNLTGIESSSPNGVSLAYIYDALNRLESVTDAHTGTTTYSYDAVGNLAGYVYPNGVASSYEYDSLNRLTNLSSAGAQDAPVAWYRYTVLPTGHRQTASENVNTASGVQTINRLYSYDATYRLVNESYSVTGPLGLPPTANVSYTLDAVGNRLSRVSTLAQLPSALYSYDANDRLTSDTYDANGNTLVGRESTRALLNCAYDFEDRLTHATTADGKTVRIWYDGDGNRVAKTVTTATDSVTTLYVVDDQNPTGYAQVLEEHVSIGSEPPSLDFVYVYGLMLISQRRGAGTSGPDVRWAASFYGYDGHNNVRYLTDLNGLVTDAYDYDAFGNLISRTGDTPNNYLYCGEQLDPDLGLYFLRARYLNPDTGRFWTMDEFEGRSSDPFTLHKYLYAHANPVAFVDRSGFFSIAEMKITVAIGAIVGAAFEVPGIWRDWDKISWEEIAQRLGVGAVEGAATALFGGITGKIVGRFIPSSVKSAFLRAAVEGAGGAGISAAAKEVFEIVFLGKPLEIKTAGRVLTATFVGFVMGGVTMKIQPTKRIVGHPEIQFQEGMATIPVPWIIIEREVMSWSGVFGSLGAEGVQNWFEDYINEWLGYK